MQASIEEFIAAAEREYNIGKGEGRFTFQEGDNRVRILSNAAALQNDYQGESPVKYL